MKDKNKNIIIVVACIATALICIILTFWGNWKNDGVLTTDAFMAVMATFIGICATLIVGVQIVSFIELREVRAQMKTIQKERELLNEQRESFKIEMHNARLGLGNALALIALTAQKNNDIMIEFESLVVSIIIDDWSSMNGSVLLNRYQRMSEIANKVVLSLNNQDYVKDTYNKLSILVVPTNIDHYNEIMTLHHELLSKLKSSNQTTA